MQKYDEDDPRNKPYEDKWDNLLFLILCILFILLLFLSLMPSKEARATDTPPNSSALTIDSPAPPVIIIDEIPASYLACYALDPQVKENCHAQIAARHFKEKVKTNASYLQEFAYRAEKVGFWQFLRLQTKPCESVADGPLYNEELGVYEVICTSGELYMMSWDSEHASWNLEE